MYHRAPTPSEGLDQALCEGDEKEDEKEVMRTQAKKGKNHPSQERTGVKTWD